MKRLYVIGLVLLGCGAEWLWAGPGVSYTYFDAGYERRFFDDPLVDDGNAFSATLSIAPLDYLFFRGDFTYARPDSAWLDASVEYLDARVGVGSQLTFLETVSLYGHGGLAYGRYTSPGRDAYDGVGFYLEPGVRVNLFDVVGLYAAGDFEYIDSNAIFGAKAGLDIGFGRHVSLSIEGGISEVSDYIGFGMRFKF